MLRKHGVVGKFVEFYGAGVAARAAGQPRHHRQHEPGVRLHHRDLPDRRRDPRLPAAHRPLRASRSRWSRRTPRSRASGTTPTPSRATPSTSSSTCRRSCRRSPARSARRTGSSLSRRQGRPFRGALADYVDETATSRRYDEARRRVLPGLRPARRTTRQRHSRADAVACRRRHATAAGRRNPATVTLADGTKFELDHGAVAIAAITSCTNTSNPSVMIGAALLAKNAVEKGLTAQAVGQDHARARARRSSPTTTSKAGLTPYLDKLGFNLVGYGCTTCIGNSGPLIPEVSAGGQRQRPRRRLGAVGQPQLRGPDQPRREDELPRVAAAGRRLRAGRLDGRRPVQRPAGPGHRTATTSSCRTSGRPPAEVEEVIDAAITTEMFTDGLRRRVRRRRALAVAADARRRHVRLGRGVDVRPQAPVLRRHAAPSRRRSPTSRAPGCWLKLGDSVTTDHISPGRRDQDGLARPGSTSPSTASSSGTSTPTARAAATTR